MGILQLFLDILINNRLIEKIISWLIDIENNHYLQLEFI